MHMEEPEVRSGVSSPTAVHPRAPAAYRTPEGRNGGPTFAPSLTKRGRRGSLRSGYARLALGALYAVLAALLGLLVEFLKHPPTVITVIVVATFFGAMIASEVSLRGRA